MKRVQFKEASAAKTQHALRASGYYFVGKPVVPSPGNVATGKMGPTKNLKDGSRHFLQAPNGAPAVQGSWLAGEAAWEIPGGDRMAFEHDYLDAHGWRYVGPVPKEQ